jgi:hypothetical protein
MLRILPAVVLLLAVHADAAPAHKTYAISVDENAGGMHVFKVSATLPDTWSDVVDKQGSPEFHRAPAGMIGAIAGFAMPIDRALAGMFGDAKNPTKITKSAGRIWIVDKNASGAIHAAMFIPEDKGHVVMCETRLDAKYADLLDEAAKTCDSVQLAK